MRFTNIRKARKPQSPYRRGRSAPKGYQFWEMPAFGGVVHLVGDSRIMSAVFEPLCTKLGRATSGSVHTKMPKLEACARCESLYLSKYFPTAP